MCNASAALCLCHVTEKKRRMMPTLSWPPPGFDFLLDRHLRLYLLEVGPLAAMMPV